jgi:anti-sigma factor RsiW
MDHIDEGKLDEYILGRLDSPDEAAVEEHILVCRTCQTQLGVTDKLIAALRQLQKKSD